MNKLDEIFAKQIIELIETIPNDMELGEKVRRLYHKSENYTNHETKKGNDPNLREGSEIRNDH